MFIVATEANIFLQIILVVVRIRIPIKKLRRQFWSLLSLLLKDNNHRTQLKQLTKKRVTSTGYGGKCMIIITIELEQGRCKSKLEHPDKILKTGWDSIKGALSDVIMTEFRSNRHFALKWWDSITKQIYYTFVYLFVKLLKSLNSLIKLYLNSSFILTFFHTNYQLFLQRMYK